MKNRRLGSCEGQIDTSMVPSTTLYRASTFSLASLKTEPLPPYAVYRLLMVDAKLRIVSAKKVLNRSVPMLDHSALDVEYCYLQVRRVIEDVTFGAMIREETRYRDLRQGENANNPRGNTDPSKDWQAPEILKRLVTLSPHALPIPHKDAVELAPGVLHLDRETVNVNHARLIDIYKRCGSFLHGSNPLRENYQDQIESDRRKYASAPSELAKTLNFLQKLLWQHAAISIEPSSSGKPTEPASPREAWLLNFGSEASPEVQIIFAEAT